MHGRPREEAALAMSSSQKNSARKRSGTKMAAIATAHTTNVNNKNNQHDEDDAYVNSNSAAAAATDLSLGLAPGEKRGYLCGRPSSALYCVTWLLCYYVTCKSLPIGYFATNLATTTRMCPHCSENEPRL
eukprot:jgi/Botrbrau1/19143/Bobra.0077s0055.1